MDPLKACIALFSYGGIEGQTFDSLMEELLLAKEQGLSVLYSRVHGDALISRSRSKALSAFLKDTDCNVFFMLDHDLEWEKGMILATCAKAHERQAVVGGLYSCRGFKMGHSGRFKAEGVTVRIGADELHDAEFIGGGFVAIPRMVAEEVLKAGVEEALEGDTDYAPTNTALALRECLYTDASKFYDFFRPITVPSTMYKGAFEYASEDWSFNIRARWANAARPQYIWTKPVLRHWGMYGFTMQTSPKER